MLGIDLGCGSKKRPGFVGLDYVAAEGVDRVYDVSKDRLPFDDGTVDEVFSSHFLEHIENAPSVLQDIVRVGKPGARVEIWTPYQKSNIAFLPGHVRYFNEVVWSHFCLEYPEMWFRDIEGMLRLDRFHYVVSKRTEETLGQVPLHFALRFFNDVVVEFGAFLTVLKGKEYLDKAKYKQSVKPPALTVGPGRELSRPLDAPQMFWRIDL